MVAVPSAGASRPNAAPISSNNTPTVRVKAANGAMPRAIVPLSARKSERLDMDTVERKGKPLGGIVEPESRSHIGDIQEAPTFRPTAEQWKNPLVYMKSIESEGKKYGIVKIVPPESWNPEFCIDTEVRDIGTIFRTTKQYLLIYHSASISRRESKS
jgi:histone demethylase JARID1